GRDKPGGGQAMTFIKKHWKKGAARRGRLVGRRYEPPAWPDVRRPAVPIASSLRRLRRLMGDADRAAHAGAAEAAITHGVLRQILLVVVLGKIECRRVEDFGGDRIEPPRLELLVVHRFR